MGSANALRNGQRPSTGSRANQESVALASAEIIMCSSCIVQNRAGFSTNQRSGTT